MANSPSPDSTNHPAAPASAEEDKTAAQGAPGDGGHGAAAGKAPRPDPKRPLSREEQMALYEEALKEEDWGHQPC